MKSQKTILITLGTRPEAIKLAPVIHNLKKSGLFKVVVCSTGQHKEMLQQASEIFRLQFDYDLELMRKNQDLFDITENSINGLKKVVKDVNPDLLMVQGDTTTAFTSALTAFYHKIPVAHIEAGLRSNNLLHPFPEEANRKFISCITDFHFAPTKVAAQNLLNEGISKKKITVSGNTVIDALNFVRDLIKEEKTASNLLRKFKQNLSNQFGSRPYVLITLHRREKFGQEMKDVLNTIKETALLHPELDFIYPVHLNPNVRVTAEEILQGVLNLYLIPPQDYLSFIYLMSNCLLILTDSGGIQEECFVFKKPVIVMREVTERTEAIEAGYAFLTGSNKMKILRTFTAIYKNLHSGYNYFKSKNPYGDGKSSEKITRVLISKLC